MNKKIFVSVLFVFVLFIFSSCTSDMPVYEDMTSTETQSITENEADSQEYRVYVLIKNEYSQIGKEYFPEDFDAELIESVEVLNQISDDDDISGYRMEYWQQKLQLNLKEPTEDNAKKAVLAAYKNPQVDIAGLDRAAFNLPDEDEDFTDEYDMSTILVVIKKECSEFGKEYYPKNFDKNLIKSVHVINQINPGDDTSGFDLEQWQQILALELKEPSEENVRKAIDAAFKNPEVEVACKNRKASLVE